MRILQCIMLLSHELHLLLLSSELRLQLNHSLFDGDRHRCYNFARLTSFFSKVRRQLPRSATTLVALYSGRGCEHYTRSLIEGDVC